MYWNYDIFFWCLFRHKVHIEVEDVNEYNPEWIQKSYKAEASEGQLFSRLVHLQAVDHDGYQGSSKICHYHVMTPDVPFEVDADGKGLSSFSIFGPFRM